MTATNLCWSISLNVRVSPETRLTHCVNTVVILISPCLASPLVTTKSTVLARELNSRSGPAGSNKPLPRRRVPSSTSTSIQREKRRFCNPSSLTRTFTSKLWRRYAIPRRRSLSTTMGTSSTHAIITASSPASAASVVARTLRLPRPVPPYPRLITAGR